MPARHAATFDTLTYAKKLEEAGFTSQQAEVQAYALGDIIDERLATKHDIALIRKDIEQIHLQIETLREGTKKDIETLREGTKKDIETLREGTKKDIETFRESMKKDMETLRESMKKDMETLRLATEHDTALIRKDIEQIHLKIETLREGTKKDMETMRLSLIIWLGGIVVASAVASVGLIATLIRLGT